MAAIKLSKRLAAIASLVPEGGGVADVGTDHGFIPVWLCQRGKNFPIFAGDINAEPLERAALTLSEYGTSEEIKLFQSDGLLGFDGSLVSSIVIAGMGGETIISILENAPWTKAPGITIIMQPMTKSPELRRWLFENGYIITSERLVEDGKIYELFSAVGGKDKTYSPAEFYIGHTELIKDDKLFAARLAELLFKLRRASEGLSRSNRKDKAARLAELIDIINGLIAMQGSIE